MPERKLPLCRWIMHDQRATHTAAFSNRVKGRSATLVCDSCADMLRERVGQVFSDGDTLEGVTRAS